MRTIEDIKADTERITDGMVRSIRNQAVATAGMTCLVPTETVIELCEEVMAYRRAEKEGRCQVLPIKPNTEFFYIDKGEVKSAVLAIYEIGHLAIFFWGVGITKRFTALIFESGKSDIGKTIFLTRPKAEAALERR